MHYELPILNNELKKPSASRLRLLVLGFFLLFFSISFSQVKTEVDTTKIRIGEQISYKIKVEADSLDLVVFPEGQTFMPLEAVEALEIDTTKKDAKFLLSRIYKLTQFDSGSYTIPRQKIIIGETPFFTDSLRVDVNTVVVDTTKQKLYDIKPIIDVEKSGGNWWKWLLGILLAIALIAFLLYWFIWRKKPLTEEEEIALLPPYDRAKLALQKLDESQYLIRAEVKEYYSELTFIIRKYLDEKVYDRALESTSSELISRLQLLKDGNQIDLSKETIKNLESILKRADLVKFAKSAPDTALAEMDKQTIDKEIDHVKERLPEPTEEEKLLDQQYKEEQERKKKRKKVILTVAISVFLLIATFVGFGIKYGFGYVKDTIVGNDSKELLEGNWVESAYGFPPVYIETPEVLRREVVDVPEELKDKIKSVSFRYLSESAGIDIEVNNITYTLPEDDQKSFNSEEGKGKDIAKSSENFIKKLETQGAENILVKRDQFSTPNAAEGLKTHGTYQIEVNGTKYDSNYIILIFRADNIKQQIVLTWRSEDTYAQDIIDRILNTVELKPDEPEEAEE
jgi:F0F1-type ATP synthase assembly protein I